MFEERREAKKLGLNVHQYRVKKRAEAAGLSYEDQSLLEVVALLRQRSGIHGSGLYAWYSQPDITHVLWARYLSARRSGSA